MRPLMERVNEPALRVVTDQPELQCPFSHYLRMLYYDSVTYHPEALDYFYPADGRGPPAVRHRSPLWGTLLDGGGNG